ncbi:MAG: hypothetical protein R2751_10430 [Bacteroidales bacterium]
MNQYLERGTDSPLRVALDKGLLTKPILMPPSGETRTTLKLGLLDDPKTLRGHRKGGRAGTLEHGGPPLALQVARESVVLLKKRGRPRPWTRRP